MNLKWDFKLKKSFYGDVREALHVLNNKNIAVHPLADAPQL